MTRETTFGILGTLLLILMSGGCTQKYALQKEADDRIIANLREENRDVLEELEEVTAERDGLRSELDSVRGQLARVTEDRDGLQNRLKDAMAKAEKASLPTRALDALAGDGVRISERNGRPTITLDSRVTFASGEADLSSQGRSILQKVAKVLGSEYRGRRIWVEGHTDNEPIRKSGYISNLHLSVARSLSVIDFLSKDGGIAPQNLVSVGHGEFDPEFSNATADGKSKNRRVEISIGDLLRAD